MQFDVNFTSKLSNCNRDIPKTCGMINNPIIIFQDCVSPLLQALPECTVYNTDTCRDYYNNLLGILHHPEARELCLLTKWGINPEGHIVVVFRIVFCSKGDKSVFNR